MYNNKTFYWQLLYFFDNILISNLASLYVIYFQDALVGFSLELKHLDGHLVSVTRDKVTWPGARIRKKGEGMPNYENNNLHGTLYITFDVEFPKSEMSEEDKKGTVFTKIIIIILIEFFVSDIKRILKQISNNRIYNGLGGF